MDRQCKIGKDGEVMGRKDSLSLFGIGNAPAKGPKVNVGAVVKGYSEQ